MIDQDKPNPVLYRVEDGVARVTLNTPGRLNVLGFGVNSNRAALVAAFARADADHEVGAILLSGAGRAFCAGADLDGVVPRTTEEEHRIFFDTAAQFLGSLRRTLKPTVAAVHGLCLGAGLNVIAQCDIVLSAADARFGLVEGAMGMPGAAELVPLVGPSWAKYLIFTGEMIDAAVAERIGLVMAILPSDRLVDAAFDMARRIARSPRECTQGNKASINAVTDAMGHPEAMARGRSADAGTSQLARFAKAPDGRLFSEILKDEGPAGLKAFRPSKTWTEHWS